MNPSFACGRSARIAPSFLAVRLRVASSLVRCELAEHPPGQSHFAYAADRPDPLPEAVWAVWSDAVPTVRFHVLPDCDTGRREADDFCCTLYEGHPPPCSPRITCLHRESAVLMAQIEFHRALCRVCAGRGRISCPHCKGFSGCVVCNGTGRVPCPKCRTGATVR